jgi:hypothetical protein
MDTWRGMGIGGRLDGIRNFGPAVKPRLHAPRLPSSHSISPKGAAGQNEALAKECALMNLPSPRRAFCRRLLWRALAASLLLFGAASFGPPAAPASAADAAPAPAILAIGGAVRSPLSLERSDLAAMPRTTITAKDKSGANITYEREPSTFTVVTQLLQYQQRLTLVLFQFHISIAKISKSASQLKPDARCQAPAGTSNANQFAHD